MVGKLGDEASLDSLELLQYNCLWSLPLSVMLVIATGEWRALPAALAAASPSFIAFFVASCASALALNWVT